MSRLIQCYGKGRASRTFECPHTSISLTLRAPTFRDRLAAESYAAAQWGDRAIESALDLRERANLNRALLIGFCLYEEGSDKPVGPAILELGEHPEKSEGQCSRDTYTGTMPRGNSIKSVSRGFSDSCSTERMRTCAGA